MSDHHDEPPHLPGHRPEEDTTEIPVVGPPQKAKIADLVWIGAGAIAGLVAMVVFAGGLGSGGDDGPAPPPASMRTEAQTRTLSPESPSRAATTVDDPDATAAATTTTPPAAAPETPAPGADTATSTTGAPTAAATDTDVQEAEPPDTAADTASESTAFVMSVTTKPGTSVYIDVRRFGTNGEQVFAGEVGGGNVKTFRADGPLWLGAGWAPSLVVRIDGREVPVEGGTDAFRVTSDGLERIPKSAG